MKEISRRDFLKFAGGAVLGAGLSGVFVGEPRQALAPTPTPEATKEKAKNFEELFKQLLAVQPGPLNKSILQSCEGYLLSPDAVVIQNAERFLIVDSANGLQSLALTVNLEPLQSVDVTLLDREKQQFSKLLFFTNPEYSFVGLTTKSKDYHPGYFDNYFVDYWDNGKALILVHEYSWPDATLDDIQGIDNILKSAPRPNLELTRKSQEFFEQTRTRKRKRKL